MASKCFCRRALKRESESLFGCGGGEVAWRDARRLRLPRRVMFLKMKMLSGDTRCKLNWL